MTVYTRPSSRQYLNGFLDRSDRDTVGLHESPLRGNGTTCWQLAGHDLLAEDVGELLIDGYWPLVVDLIHVDQRSGQFSRGATNVPSPRTVRT